MMESNVINNTLEIKLASAKDLNNLNLFAKMDVYAVVFISGDPLHNQKTKSPVDKAAGVNPAWNFPIKLTFNESLARQNRLTVEIRLRCVRTLSADKDIGTVNIPLNELLDHSGAHGQTFQYVTYQVRKPSGKPKGTFNFSYKFAHQLANYAPTLSAYPPPPVMPYAGSYLYPPQPLYLYPQQPVYGYPKNN